MKQLSHLLLLILLLLLPGCSLFFVQPTVSVQDLAIVGLDSGGIECELYLRVDNPNNFAITLTGYTYDLNVFALPFTNGGSQREVPFPANAPTDVRLPVRVKIGAFYELFKRRPDPDKIPYHLTGSLQLSTPLGHELIPFDKKGLFAIPASYRPDHWLKQFKEGMQEILRFE